MNTPRTPKRNKRYAGWEKALGNPTIPYGRFEHSIKDPKFCAALGRMVVAWPQVEAAMEAVLERLLGRVDPDVAAEVFHFVQTNSARVKLMEALLENPSVNSKLPQDFDKLIADFSRLAEQRNRYVHAVWTTHESGAIICSPQRKDPRPHLFGKEVKLEELQRFLEECEELGIRAKFLQPRTHY